MTSKIMKAVMGLTLTEQIAKLELDEIHQTQRKVKETMTSIRGTEWTTPHSQSQP